MLTGEEREEAFFDTAEELVSEEGSEYDVWLSEPQSVRERRESFLSRMGLSESRMMMGFDGIEESFEENLLSQRRKSNSEANCSTDFSDVDWLDDSISYDVERDVVEMDQVEDCLRDSPTAINLKTKKVMSWLRSISLKMKRNISLKEPKLGGEGEKTRRMRVEEKHKRYIECSALYAEQRIKAHDGLIWSMRFSPNGEYLASGGEDGVVCVWRVATVHPNCNPDKWTYGDCSEKSKLNQASVVIPEKIFHLEEEPVRVFKGHSCDVLDLSWSTSNHLLSSSMDKTVRLWYVDSDECLGVFHHSNYVTCVQFNPVEESSFISGSIDGKVRVWSIQSSRVEKWANVGGIVTAACYQPNGEGFVVGTLSGNCCFYESSGDELLLNAELNIHGKRKSSGNKITGIQFLNNDSQRLMITSEDSKIRILDGLETVHKYKGASKSGSQMWASFTPNGKHIVSIGDDSRVYLWNQDDEKQAKSTRSCESFSCKGVSVVLPWSNNVGGGGGEVETDGFSIANWFSMDVGSSRLTWPEERLPLWDVESVKEHGHVFSTWGLVFVTANSDGTIRTFHNHGLPLRI